VDVVMLRWRLRLARVWTPDSVFQFCVGAYGSNLASVALKLFSHLIYFVQINFIMFMFSMRCAKIMLK
jgi:hypothetical protein